MTFKLQDAMTVDVSRATVVTLYLLSSSNLKLRPILTKQLKPGARIVSHAFDMGDWEPSKIDRFDDQMGIARTLYLWKADGDGAAVIGLAHAVGAHGIACYTGALGQRLRSPLRVPEWRNWQTRGTQNPVGFTPRVGSIPSSGTSLRSTSACLFLG